MKLLLACSLTLASTLCLAQTSATQTRTAAQEDAAVAASADKAPTVAEIDQQIKTLIAVRQVYSERLDKITEFQRLNDANNQISQLEAQKRQIAIAQGTKVKKDDGKQEEKDFKEKMKERIAAEKAADAAKAAKK